MELRIFAWISVSLLPLAIGGVMCPAYQCATAAVDLGANGAIYNANAGTDGTVYIQTGSCGAFGETCSAKYLPSPDGQATTVKGQIPIAYSKALVNEPCSSPNDCLSEAAVNLSPKCTGGVCVGFLSKNAACTSSNQCDVELHCDANSKVCAVLLPVSTGVCTEDHDGVMNAFCITTKGAKGYSTCAKYYSLSGMSPCSDDR